MGDRQNLDRKWLLAVDNKIRESSQREAPAVGFEEGPPVRGFRDGCNRSLQVADESLCYSQAPLTIPSDGGFRLGKGFGMEFDRLTAHCGV